MNYIQTRTDGHFYFITINRPGKRNAFTLEMIRDFAAAVQAADETSGARAIIVSAEGSVFSAGIDVLGLMQARAEAGEQNPGRWLRRWVEDLQYHLNRIESVELPVIGALNGQVIGFGLELALAFDLRIASNNCQLSIPETRLGLVADLGGATRLSRVIGPARAKDMLMTARSVGAEEALQWGLLNRVVAEEALLDSAIALAQQIAQNAPLAVGMAKRIIDQGDGLDKHTQMALERWAQSLLITTEDVTEAMTAFMQKRPPEFKGR
ncbi:MAG TPA: enoyl-CoA hydratase/isomerase family protein [Chloroflexi bacterium]|nr:enoyl-CoA hydratase/isomerase family protein [Chloroflexota bacterium]